MPHKRADTVSDANQPQVLIHGVDYNKVLDDVDQANVHRAANGNPHGTTASDIGAAAAGHTHNPETLGAATPASVATSIAEHTSTAPHLTAGQAAAAAPVQSVAGLAGAPNAAQLKAALAISTSDVSGNFDGSRITGTLPLSVLPKSAIHELKMIVNDADRFSLTLTDVQLHDSVKSSSTGLMWFLKDEANIGNSAGWEQYTAGPQGPKGDKGDKGDPGEKGDTGPAGPGSGDMLASVYDPNGDGKIATAQISGLAAVATTGSYNDLANTPDLSLKADLVAGKVPANQLPSFVDDVLEFANLAAFPATGESGKQYVAINAATAADPSKIYRWSGTVYTEISPSPGSTSDVPEGSNLYHTPARAAAAAPVQSVAGYVGAVSAEQIRGALPAAVAGGASGLMTGADKTKLDATASQTELAAKAPLDNPLFTTGVRSPKVNGGASSGWKNKIINGCMRISLRGNGPAVLGVNRLGADGIITTIGGWSSISGAAITRDTAAVNDGRYTTGAAHYVALGTCTGASGYIIFATRIEAADAQELGGRVATASARLHAWATAPSNYYFRIYKANALNDFSAQTLISQSPNFGPLPINTTVTPSHSFTIPDGAGTTGLQVELVVEYSGAVAAGSYLFLGDYQFSSSSQAEPFELRPIAAEEALRHRYLRKQAIWVGTSGARTVMPIGMLKTPTLSGGGTGFNSTGTDKDTLVCYQTTAGLHTLTLDAEL